MEIYAGIARILRASWESDGSAPQLPDRRSNEAPPLTAEVQGSLRDLFRGKLTQGPAVMIG
jgi:hypothetical protein